MTIEPDNSDLISRIEEVSRARAANHSTVPSNLGIEKRTNPFLRADVPALQTAFGMTKRQKLLNVQIPLALPNIMAGVNQTIMMSLAMVVIASMVTAPGLGVLVLRGIRNLELGVGLMAGICIVLLAVMLDRTSKAALSRIDRAKSKTS